MYSNSPQRGLLSSLQESATLTDHLILLLEIPFYFWILAVCLFIFREWRRGGGRESQVGSTPRMEPNVGLDLTSLRSRPETILSGTLYPLSHPGAPGTIILKLFSGLHQIKRGSQDTHMCLKYFEI